MEENGKVIHVTTTGLRIYPFILKRTCPWLVKYNSIIDYAYHRQIPTTGFLSDKSTYAMFRMNLNKLQQILPDYIIRVDEPEYAWNANRFHINSDIKWTELQQKTLDEVANIQIAGKDRAFINLQTGRGKTLLSIELIIRSADKSLIFCYSKSVLAQWKKTLIEHTDIDPKRILHIKGSETLDKINSGKIDPNTYDIYLMTPMLAESYASTYGWEAFSKVVQNMHIGVKVYDEAHRNIKAMVLIDAYTNIEMTYYLSADFAQANNDKERLFYNMFWDVPIINPVNQVDEDLNYVAVMCIDYNSNPSIADLAGVQTKRGFQNFAYMKYQYSKPYIYTAIDKVMDAVLRHNPEHYRLLVLTAMIDHANLVYEYIQKKYGDAVSIGRFHGKVDADEKQRTIDTADVIVATYSSFGVGTDVRNIQFVLSLDQVDMITDNQAAGRARPIEGRKAFYFIISDMGFTRCSYSKRKRISYLQSSKATGFYNSWIGDGEINARH